LIAVLFGFYVVPRIFDLIPEQKTEVLSDIEITGEIVWEEVDVDFGEWFFTEPVTFERSVTFEAPVTYLSTVSYENEED